MTVTVTVRGVRGVRGEGEGFGWTLASGALDKNVGRSWSRELGGEAEEAKNCREELSRMKVTTSHACAALTLTLIP